MVLQTIPLFCGGILVDMARQLLTVMSKDCHMTSNILSSPLHINSTCIHNLCSSILISYFPSFCYVSSPSSLFSPSSFFFTLDLFSSSFPLTDAIVTVEFTKKDIDDYPSDDDFDWSKEQALVLTVGDIITDVKLVCL